MPTVEEVKVIKNMIDENQIHLFYCRIGAHWGVSYGLLMECPSGCSRGYYLVLHN
jgi:hypothetical protein